MFVPATITKGPSDNAVNPNVSHHHDGLGRYRAQSRPATTMPMATKLNAAVYSTNATGAVAWPSPHSHFETG